MQSCHERVQRAPCPDKRNVYFRNGERDARSGSAPAEGQKSDAVLIQHDLTTIEHVIYSWCETAAVMY